MNFWRMLLSLLATSALACAAVVVQPAGLVVRDGEVKEYDNQTIQTPSVTVESGGTLVPSEGLIF